MAHTRHSASPRSHTRVANAHTRCATRRATHSSTAHETRDARTPTQATQTATYAGHNKLHCTDCIHHTHTTSFVPVFSRAGPHIHGRGQPRPRLTHWQPVWHLLRCSSLLHIAAQIATAHHLQHTARARCASAPPDHTSRELLMHPRNTCTRHGTPEQCRAERSDCSDSMPHCTYPPPRTEPHMHMHMHAPHAAALPELTVCRNYLYCIPRTYVSAARTPLHTHTRARTSTPLYRRKARTECTAERRDGGSHRKNQKKPGKNQKKPETPQKN